MSDEVVKLTADLRRTREQLAVRTKERDDVKLRLNKNDVRITTMRKELAKAHEQLDKVGADLSISTANLKCRELELAEQSVKVVIAQLETTKQTKLLKESDVSLEARTAELEKANRDLKLTMRRQDEFVAAVTHDLKSPLLGATRILEMLAAGQVSTENQNAVFSQLLESHREMLRMILNMLDVYRHDGGAITPVFGTVSISSLLNDCMETFSFNIAEKNLSTVIEVEADAEKVIADVLLLKRVLTNLISNAVKFSKVGGQIKVSVTRREANFQISVRDNGVGMNPEQKTNVFQRILQPGRDSNVHTGTGLGLYLSRELAVAMAGDLTFSSELNLGSEFVLTLPVDRDPSDSSKDLELQIA